MSEEVKVETLIAVKIVFNHVDNNLHLESSATFNKKQEIIYKIATIEIIQNPECDEVVQNDCPVLKSFIDVNPNIRNIVSMKLSQCKLSNIPTSFYILPLKTLDLSYNLLKSVPVCILMGLVNLEELNLGHNKIRCFKTEPKCILKLIILNLESNLFTNFPVWILEVKCKNLKSFYFNNNELTSLKMSRFTLTARYKLTNIYLRNCSVMDVDFKVLKTIRTLKTIDLGNIGNKNCNEFNKLELLFDEAHFANYIETFCVSNTSLSDIPENIINIKYLKHLNISNNNLSWLPDCIVNLRYLEYLNFGCNGVVRLPRDINKLENLEELLGPFNSLTAISVVNMPRLRNVDFYSNEINTLDCNLDYLCMADFEQNYIDTTRLPLRYTQCLNTFRTKHIDQYRLFNEKDDIYLERNEFDYDKRSASSFSSSNGDLENTVIAENQEANIITNNQMEDDMEVWDVVVDNKFTEISFSDSEWKGDFNVPKNKNCIKRTACVLVDYMFEDAD